MLKNVEAVIFDLDGTLVDSMWMWKTIDIEYLQRYGIEFPSNIQNEIEGYSFTETAIYFKEKFNLEDEIDKIKEDWNLMAMDKYLNEVPLKEGAKEFLEYLKRNQIKAGIATSNSRELVDLLIDKLEIRDYFQSIRTSCEVRRGKPYPDVYELVASDLGVHHNKCIVFEDIVNGIIGGKTAKMKVCAVQDDYSNDQIEEKKRLADYYIESYYEILK